MEKVDDILVKRIICKKEGDRVLISALMSRSLVTTDEKDLADGSICEFVQGEIASRYDCTLLAFTNGILIELTGKVLTRITDDETGVTRWELWDRKGHPAWKKHDEEDR